MTEEWTIQYGVEGKLSEEALDELAYLIIDWAEKYKVIVGGGIAPAEDDEDE